MARVLTYRHSEAQLAQDSGLPPDIVREGLKQFQALYLQGNMPLSSNAGVESQGIGTVTILVQGGKLCILADVSETMAFFGMEAVGETIQKFTELKEVPDTFALPSLSAVYLKTGDALVLPWGFLCVEKNLNELTVSLKTHTLVMANSCLQSFLSVSEQQVSWRVGHEIFRDRGQQKTFGPNRYGGRTGDDADGPARIGRRSPLTE